MIAQRYKRIADQSKEDGQQEQMAEWVNGLAPWEDYGTFTYRWEAGLWSAVKGFTKFYNRHELRNVSYFLGVEENPGRDGYHLHAIFCDHPVRRSVVWREWFKVYGRIRLTPIVEAAEYWQGKTLEHQVACASPRAQAVADYVSKYVCKEGTWWDVRMCGFRHPESLRPGQLTLTESGVVRPNDMRLRAPSADGRHGVVLATNIHTAPFYSRLRHLGVDLSGGP